MKLFCQLKTESTYVPARRMLKNKIATCIIKNNNIIGIKKHKKILKLQLVN